MPRANERRVSSGESVERGLHAVCERPSADHRIEAQDEEPGEDTERTDQRPCTCPAAARGDGADRADRAAAPAPADRELGEHERHHHERQAEEVEEHERAPAVRADLVREFPDAADADRGSDRGEDEADAS